MSGRGAEISHARRCQDRRSWGRCAFGEWPHNEVAVAENPKLKVEAAKRRILAVNGRATIEAYPCRWQDRPEPLRGCDIVLGNLDSFTERQQLEAFCRRQLIPYIDIGMDVHQAGEEPPRICGQVILSMPGYACMRCMKFLTAEKLGREANTYGAAGGRPQVVWPNGVLASIAVGVAIDLLTDWSRSLRGPVWLVYVDNTGTVAPENVRLPRAPKSCEHYPLDQVGEPVFTKL